MSDLVERVRDVLPSVRRDLEDLVRIESVGADPARSDEVQRSAEAVAKLLSQAGFGDVQIVSEGGAPAVIARHPAPDGRADGAAVCPSRRAARGRSRPVGVAAVRADRARRPSVRPRQRRRQGRHRNASRRVPRARWPAAGRCDGVRRGRGGVGFAVAGPAAGRAQGRAGRRRHRHRRLRQLEHRDPRVDGVAARARPTAWWRWPRSTTACTRVCGAAWCPTR